MKEAIPWIISDEPEANCPACGIMAYDPETFRIIPPAFNSGDFLKIDYTGMNSFNLQVGEHESQVVEIYVDSVEGKLNIDEKSIPYLENCTIRRVLEDGKVIEAKIDRLPLEVFKSDIIYKKGLNETWEKAYPLE